MLLPKDWQSACAEAQFHMGATLHFKSASECAGARCAYGLGACVCMCVRACARACVCACVRACGWMGGGLTQAWML